MALEVYSKVTRLSVCHQRQHVSELELPLPLIQEDSHSRNDEESRATRP